MELCTARGMSSPPIHPKPLAPSPIRFQSLGRCKTHFPFLHKQTRFNSGLQYYSKSSQRSTTSEETKTDTSDRTLSVEDEPKIDGGMTVEDSQLNEAPQEGSLTDNPLQLFKFLEDFNIKFDYEETYSILVFGGGGVVALWLVAAVLSAIDSIPVFPKVLELVGLGYTLWFSSRYLIFKKNRDELVGRVEQIKQQILGAQDE